SAPVVRATLESTPISARLGSWLAEPEHAERVATEGAAMASGLLSALSDDEVRDVIESLAREHLIASDWGAPIGTWLERLVTSEAHGAAVDLVADSTASWLVGNRATFDGLISRRLPSWVPWLAHRFVDDTGYGEAV